MIDVLNSSVRDQSGHWSLFLEAKAIMQLLPEVKLSKISRVSNRVAHVLAQLGKHECGVSHGVLPSCVSEALLLDCNNAVA